jgi:riboflavin synthase
MFTGIVEATANVLQNTGHTLTIERPAAFDDLNIGSSICVAGVCLSIVATDEQSMRFDVVEETLARSNLGSKKAGDTVNLERAMKANARLDGHVVQGHVEGTGIVRSAEMRLCIEIPPSLSKNVHPKGSIAIDGVSLTVASIEQNLCTIALIPHTLERTTLGSLRFGDIVNIETDVMTRAI